MIKKKFQSNSVEDTASIGCMIGKNLLGGEVIELQSDLGGGKTTFVGGLARGLGSDDPVASPSFTLNYIYRCKGDKRLSHFDFYRLDDAGILSNELAEVLEDPQTVVAVEWGDIVHDVLPEKRIKVNITANGDAKRVITCLYPKEFDYLFKSIIIPESKG